MLVLILQLQMHAFSNPRVTVDDDGVASSRFAENDALVGPSDAAIDFQVVHVVAR